MSCGVCVICGSFFEKRNAQITCSSFCSAQRIKSQRVIYVEKHREYILQYKKEYREKNNEEILLKQREYSILHPEVGRKAKKKWKKKKRQEVQFRLRESVSRSIARYLGINNGKKEFPSWLILPYTIQQFCEHLAGLWLGEKSWMNWENYGPYKENERTWNIDHITPQSALPYDSLTHPNFLKCWDLSNIQPLEAKENSRKGNKILND